jgi:hypothetical protein
MSPLQAFLKPPPGEPKISANFPEATVEITRLEEVKEVRTQWILCGAGALARGR